MVFRGDLMKYYCENERKSIMKIKKNIVMIMAAVMAVSSLAACGSNGQTEETTASETVSETASETAAPETESSEESTSETSESVSEAETEESTEGETGEDESAVSPLMEYADAAMSAGEWPEMEAVSDKYILSDYFLLDADNENYRDLLVMQCPMSANMSEFIIIEADDTQAAADDLKARREKAQNGDAFYPDDVDKANDAIVGTAGDYAYFIMCFEPEKAEEALLLKIGE